jgi:Kef-type K+ transport system membrane component KefB
MVPVLFLQIAVVLGVSYLVRLGAARLGQPPVIAQLVAGVAIGPSLLGLLPGGVEHSLFPASSLPALQALGQLGVALYMFTIGAGLDLRVVRQTVRTGLAVSISGTVVPLAVGALIAVPLVQQPGFFPSSTPPAIASLFLAVSMAVTAFPVLARIIADRGLLDAPIASLCLACGAFSDAAAWCLLALVVAGAAGRPGSIFGTLAGTVALALVVLVAGRPLLARLARGTTPARFEPLALVALMAVAGCSDIIGVHPAFGAFLLGTVMPRGEATQRLCQRIDPLATAVLLPLFFATAGLTTRLGLIDRPALVLVMVGLTVAATVSKGVSCGVAAWLTGQPPRESLAVGVLMNTRGLVELIVLSVGLQRHVITPTLYAMLVVVCGVTTFLPGPVLSVLYRRQPRPEAETVPAPSPSAP